MKILTILVFALGIGVVIPAAFALTPGYNELEKTFLHAETATISLDIEFGTDKYQALHSKINVQPQLENISLKLYDNEIEISDPQLRVVGDGKHFRILSVPDGILIYGHKNAELNNYKINIFMGTNKGLEKFSVSTDVPLEDDKVIETEVVEEKPKYIPELIIDTSHDYRTYWKETFDIDVRAFDANINPKAQGFSGKLDDVDVTVIISFGDEIITTLKGITTHGQWKGEHYIKENLVQAGEYTVDVLAQLNNKTVSHSSSMFVIGTVGGSDTTNHTPVAVAGSDQTVSSGTLVILSGAASSDSDGDVITYLWGENTAFGIGLNSTDTQGVQFTAPVVVANQDVIVQLTVTDPKGKSSIDTVTVTVTP